MNEKCFPLIAALVNNVTHDGLIRNDLIGSETESNLNQPINTKTQKHKCMLGRRVSCDIISIFDQQNISLLLLQRCQQPPA